MALIIIDKYKYVVDLVVMCKGCIFGGAVRDFISEKDPIDIDVSIPDDAVQNFYEKLQIAKYKYLKENIFSNGNIIIDVVESSGEMMVEINVPP